MAVTVEVKTYKQKLVWEFSQHLTTKGFVAYIAKAGDYGFFTNAVGARCVSFYVNGGIVHLSGEYAASINDGSSWPLDVIGNVMQFSHASLDELLHTPAPRWANKNPAYTTAAAYLKNWHNTSVHTLFTSHSSH